MIVINILTHLHSPPAAMHHRLELEILLQRE